jgi:hypothetical protein
LERLQEWQRSPEYQKQQELKERHNQEQQELYERHHQEQQELYERHGQELESQLYERHERETQELDERHDRERQEVGLPPARELPPAASAMAEPMVQVLTSDLNQVAISLVSTGAAMAIAKAVKKFRKSAPAAKVEFQGDPRPAQGNSPSPPRPHSA